MASGISNLWATPIPTPNVVPISDGSSLLNAWVTSGSGSGGSPGGADTQLQYNAAGAFGGISGATSDGANTTFASDKLRATSPRFITSLSDANGLSLLGLTPTASAVNYAAIANAATGSYPTFTGTGTDSDIGFSFFTKGNGVFNILNSGGVYMTFDNTPAVRFKTAGTTKTLIGVAAGTDSIITGSLAGDYCVRADNSRAILFSTDAGSSYSLRIGAAAGAVDFANSGGIYLTVDATPALRYKNGGTTRTLTGVSTGTDSIINGSVAGDFCVRADNSNAILFSTDAGTSVQLRIGAGGGGISTLAPSGASAHAWKLGSVVSGAVSLDTANSVYVDINGTVVKLLKAA